MSSAPQGAPEKPTGRIAFAQALLSQRPLFGEGNLQILRDSLVPGTEERRYRKDWRLGQVLFGPQLAQGRLGFEREHPTATDVWDEDIVDFVESEFPTGAVSPFAIRVNDLVIAFQLRGNDIDVGSFTYALEAIMRKASGLPWRVVPLRTEVSFDEWAKNVNVTSLTAYVRRPNPNYKGRPDVEEFIEGPGAEVAVAKWRAPVGGSLNVEDALIQQFVEHADRKKYGRLRAKGLRGRLAVSYSDTGEDRIETVGVDAQTGEVGVPVLAGVLESEASRDDGEGQ